jgi:hypothetical protein
MNRISEHIGRNGLRAAYFSAPCSQTALQFDEQLLSRSDAENFYRLSGLIQRSRLRPTGLPKGRHGECLSSGGPRPEDYCWRRKAGQTTEMPRYRNLRYPSEIDTNPLLALLARIWWYAALI